MKKLIKFINRLLGTDKKVEALRRSLYKSLELQKELHQEVRAVRAGYETLFDRENATSNRLTSLDKFVHDELRTDYKYKNKYCVVVGNQENLSDMKILPEVYISESKAWESLRDKYENYGIMWVLKIQLAGVQQRI